MSDFEEKLEVATSELSIASEDDKPDHQDIVDKINADINNHIVKDDLNKIEKKELEHLGDGEF